MKPVMHGYMFLLSGVGMLQCLSVEAVVFLVQSTEYISDKYIDVVEAVLYLCAINGL